MLYEAGWVVERALGVVFLAAALLKAAKPARFIRGVREYDVAPQALASYVAWLIIAAESFVGIAQLTGSLSIVAISFALALLTAFAFAVGVNLAKGRVFACHCFGDHGELISIDLVLRIALLTVAELFVLGTRISSDDALTGVAQRMTVDGVLVRLPGVLCTLLIGLWILALRDMSTVLPTRFCRRCGQ